MQLTIRCFLALLAVWTLLSFAGLAAAASDTNMAPRRIVSLNLCADQLVLALADRDTVLSVTWLARDPNISTMATEAAHVSVNHGLAEEIIPLAPELVVAGVYTTRTAVALLRRLDIPLVEVGVPQSIPAVYEQIRTVARALGHLERGEAMVAGMAAELAALGPPPEALGPVAALYQPNGFIVGRGSLIDDLLTRAGLRNLAAELAIDNYGWLPLDVLLLRRPNLLILNTRNDVAPSLMHQGLRHPALVKAFPRLRTLIVPQRLWNCAGPWTVEVVARLRAVARRLTMAEEEP